MKLLIATGVAIGLAVIAARAQAPATATTIEPIHFHHVHLNSVDPAAAAAYYPKPFAQSATRTTFNGFEAVKTGNIYILFTKVNTPLSSYGFGGEFYRRKGQMDIVAGAGFQKMGPPDGNWLGKGKDAVKDTDYVQVRGLGIVGVDAAFIWRTYLNDNFSVHYGAGLGLAFVKGEVLRTSNATT